jgi:curved DNA-binding protein CbpA
MFIDYYEILEIAETATSEEIKAAFRKQAIKWHPDRNPGKDTTIQMQRINEAYLILKDPEARQKFDLEYQRFKGYKKEQKQEKEQQYQTNSESTNTASSTQKENKTEYESYTFNDDTLKNWMNNARMQSVDLAKQTIKDFKGMVSVGFKEGVKASGNALIGQIVISIIVLIILGLSKSCNS